MPIVNPPNRVLQLDGKLLDDELYSSLSSGLTEAFRLSTLPQSIQRFGTEFAPELRLLLKLALFKVTVWDKGSTYGLTLQNLGLRDGSTGHGISKFRRLLLLSSIILSHLYERLESHIYASDDRYTDAAETTNISKISLRSALSVLTNRLKYILPKLDKLYTLLSLSNFLVFLVKGRYPTLGNRILGIAYSPLSSLKVSLASNPETISYEFQDRQLVWNTLTEFLAFTLPLISIPKLSRNIRHLIGGRSRNPVPPDAMLRFLPESCCAVCYQKQLAKSSNGEEVSVEDNLVTNPYITNCGHIYCYNCIVSKLEEFGNDRSEYTDENEVEDDGLHWNCLRCAKPVIYCKVYDGDCEEALGEKTEEYEDETDDTDDGEHQDVVDEGDEEIAEDDDTQSDASGSTASHSSHYDEDELEEMVEDGL
ncbi:DEKNAAC104452 [Brettanomyces naardenensis]|uniref:DEKNAAC104452 n=1 Tax=Brettanomyces naardenensis TaxID=13370 RepID=A0A448YRL9_BRENA|nr:DEKNAAC104452 [Brettanomyces naardenensis]